MDEIENKAAYDKYKEDLDRRYKLAILDIARTLRDMHHLKESEFMKRFPNSTRYLK